MTFRFLIEGSQISDTKLGAFQRNIVDLGRGYGTHVKVINTQVKLVDADQTSLQEAAPDLLKACQVVTAFLDRLDVSASNLFDETLYNLRKQIHAPLRAALDPAIAKATRKL
jgi:hypothetical protein